MKDLKDCPCGGGAYAQCCKPYLEDGVPAPSAEKLMRSRYSAYVLGLHDYVLRTWAAETRPAASELDGDGVKWLGLEVKKHVPGESNATVEFVARYKVGGRAHRLHELSRFVKEDGAWYYLDGSFPERQEK